MKRALLLAALTFFSSASEAGPGVGISVRSDDYAIYLPFDINSSFRLEPYASFYRDEGTMDDPAGTSRSVSQSTFIGLGAFSLMGVTDHIRAYAGGRVSYARTKRETTGGSFTIDTEYQGYSLEPALGVEYLVTERVLVGAEEYAFYERTHGDFSGIGFKDTTFGTGNRLVLRLMF